jgi:hypothetical protein
MEEAFDEVITMIRTEVRRWWCGDVIRDLARENSA